ncbi:hypothetical protein P691DRAFT_794787 [Macrolepiota fuliginosa MF-IS2]|uniref:Reverse transcriptase domain-containing protein n=1 Tax=Macrolepiota fuliginosa MF-IS2 TaxID=1400762 RepID=A0A9P6C2F3_9AGAR|nr:hypothetical protein P691DRAFT_794787 [Macrolepiota fuliginosa MF-IS2]
MIQTSNIEGLKIPRLRENLKVLLFMDDTIVFLTKEDSFKELTTILDTWCKASDRIWASQGMKDKSTAIPEEIHIVQEGELTHILGTWFGNMESEQPWTTIVDKTQTQLTRWNRSHPTLEGTRLINQVETRGRTQYLTKAQGMPPNIKDKIEKIIKEYIWHNHPTKEEGK